MTLNDEKALAVVYETTEMSVIKYYIVCIYLLVMQYHFHCVTRQVPEIPGLFK